MERQNQGAVREKGENVARQQKKFQQEYHERRMGLGTEGEEKEKKENNILNLDTFDEE